MYNSYINNLILGRLVATIVSITFNSARSNDASRTSLLQCVVAMHVACWRPTPHQQNTVLQRR